MITNLKQNVREPSFKLMKYILTQFCFHTSNINSKTTFTFKFLSSCFQSRNKNEVSLSYQYCFEDFITTLLISITRWISITSGNYKGEVNSCEVSGKHCFTFSPFPIVSATNIEQHYLVLFWIRKLHEKTTCFDYVKLTFLSCQYYGHPQLLLNFC